MAGVFVGFRAGFVGGLEGAVGVADLTTVLDAGLKTGFVAPEEEEEEVVGWLVRPGAFADFDVAGVTGLGEGVLREANEEEDTEEEDDDDEVCKAASVDDAGVTGTSVTVSVVGADIVTGGVSCF